MKSLRTKVLSFLMTSSFAAALPPPALAADDLPLVANRTRIASRALSRQLSELPAVIIANAACIAVLSRDAVGWGLMGAEIGAGLVSCRLPNGVWSAPSYLSLESVALGPNIGFMRQDTTFLFMAPELGRVFRPSFTFDAGVYAVAASAEAQLSLDSTGCVTVDLLRERHRHCTLAVSDDFGLKTGAYVSAVNVRHMNGFFGGGMVGRNKRVYGRGVSVAAILSMPANFAPEVTLPWTDALMRAAP